MLPPDPGKEHAQVVVYLRNRPDGAARVPAAAFLLDRNRRAKPRNVIDVRLGQLPEKLPGVRAERFQIPPLPLGEQRVEREATLAAARHPGKANQLAARKCQRHVTKIVLPRAFDRYASRFHRFAFFPSIGRAIRPRQRKPPTPTAADPTKQLAGIGARAPSELPLDPAAGQISRPAA